MSLTLHTSSCWIRGVWDECRTRTYTPPWKGGEFGTHVSLPLFGKERTMFRSLLALFILFQAGATRSLPATDVKAADIQATVEREKSTNTTDIPIRTVDAGGHNVGIAVVHRGKGTNLMAAAVHDKISEVYQVLEGSGTFVTGGRLVNPQRREANSEIVTQLSGPG